MTINEWLQEAQRQLKSAAIESYPLDSLVLLEHVTRLNRAHILAHQDKQLSSLQVGTLARLLKRRIGREPIAYITGVKEFYGREFYVDKNVLIPRPESESFIELLKKHQITHQSIIDVGSGSGILGITAKLELPTSNVTLIDIDKNALEVAKKNAIKLNTNVNFLQSDLLESLPSIVNRQSSIILANLPYVPKTIKLEPELAYEPSIALFADNNGLALYERLWQQINGLTSCTYVLTESLESQHHRMTVLAQNAQFKLTKTNGLVQLFAQNR